MNDEKLTLRDVENSFADLLQEEIDKEILLKLKITAALPYTVELSNEMPILTASKWCRDYFGKEWDLYNSEGIWGYVHWEKSKGIVWYFKNEKDAILFKLRW